MRIASERSINRSFSYINKIRGIKKTFPQVVFEYKKENCLLRETNRDKVKIFESTDFITPDCFRMFDIITDKFLKNYYKIKNHGLIPTSPYQNCSIKNTSDDLNEILNKKEPIYLEFSDQEICDNYGFIFKKITNSTIYNLLNYISNIKFKIRYDCRVYKLINDNKIKFYYICLTNLNDNDNYLNLFNVEVLNQSVGKNEKIYERLYKLTFSSKLGISFLENIKSINIDWIPDEYYIKLNNNELIFYKIFILPQFNNTSLSLSIFDVKERMGLITNDKSNIKFFTNNILNSLKTNKIIKDFKFSGLENFIIECKKK